MFPFLIPLAFFGTAYYVSRPTYVPRFGAGPMYAGDHPMYGRLPRSFPPSSGIPLSRNQMASGAPSYGASFSEYEDEYGVDGEDDFDDFDEDDDFDDDYGASISDRSELFFDGNDKVSLFSTTLDEF